MPRGRAAENGAGTRDLRCLQMHGLPVLHDRLPIPGAVVRVVEPVAEGAQVRPVLRAPEQGRAHGVHGGLSDRRYHLRRARGAGGRGAKAHPGKAGSILRPHLRPAGGGRHHGAHAFGSAVRATRAAYRSAAGAAADADLERALARARHRFHRLRSAGRDLVDHQPARGSCQGRREAGMKPKITIWRTIFALVALAGLYATFLRITQGLGGSTNLSDQFPWGIWIGFDILCGVGLAAGGFTLVAVVHIFNIERYRPILRPSILTAFLGYLLVVLALMFDLGRPDRVWHPLVMWNPHSVMYEVGWCVTLYTTVLALEFLPMVLEKFAFRKSLAVVRAISVPLMIAGVILSTLHQSSLGSLYLIVPHKLYGLWYTPLLPVLFYISAIGAGLAMTIFESWHSSKAFGRQLEIPLLASMARVLAVVLSVYLTIRYLDLSKRGALGLLAQNRTETWLFGLEILLMAVPMVLL